MGNSPAGALSRATTASAARQGQVLPARGHWQPKKLPPPLSPHPPSVPPIKGGKIHGSHPVKGGTMYGDTAWFGSGKNCPAGCALSSHADLLGYRCPARGAG